MQTDGAKSVTMREDKESYQELRDYLKSINVPKTLEDRIFRLTREWCELVSRSPDFSFLSEAQNKEGKVVYKSLWIMSGSHVMEFKNIVSQENMDLVNLHKRVTWAEINKENFDFVTATDGSKISAHARFVDGNGAEFSATGKNCERAVVFIRRLLDHFVGS